MLSLSKGYGISYIMLQLRRVAGDKIANNMLMVGCLILLVGVYKALDWLLRRFYIGRLGDRSV